MKRFSFKRFMLISLAAVLAFAAPFLVLKTLLFLLLAGFFMAAYTMRRMRSAFRGPRPVNVSYREVHDVEIS